MNKPTPIELIVTKLTDGYDGITVSDVLIPEQCALVQIDDMTIHLTADQLIQSGINIVPEYKSFTLSVAERQLLVDVLATAIEDKDTEDDELTELQSLFHKLQS